jgi:hypothetical protein
MPPSRVLTRPEESFYGVFTRPLELELRDHLQRFGLR